MNFSTNPSLLCLQLLYSYPSVWFTWAIHSPSINHSFIWCFVSPSISPFSVRFTTCSIQSISPSESLCLATPFKHSFVSLPSTHFSAGFVQSRQQVGPWTGTFRPGWVPLPWSEHFRQRNEPHRACGHLTFLWHLRRPFSVLRTCTYL